MVLMHIMLSDSLSNNHHQRQTDGCIKYPYKHTNAYTYGMKEGIL